MIDKRGPELNIRLKSGKKKYVLVPIKYSFTALYHGLLICPGQFQNKARIHVLGDSLVKESNIDCR